MTRTPCTLSLTASGLRAAPKDTAALARWMPRAAAALGFSSLGTAGVSHLPTRSGGRFVATHMGAGGTLTLVLDLNVITQAPALSFHVSSDHRFCTGVLVRLLQEFEPAIIEWAVCGNDGPSDLIEHGYNETAGGVL